MSISLTFLLASSRHSSRFCSPVSPASDPLDESIPKLRTATRGMLDIVHATLHSTSDYGLFHPFMVRSLPPSLFASSTSALADLQPPSRYPDLHLPPRRAHAPPTASGCARARTVLRGSHPHGRRRRPPVRSSTVPSLSPFPPPSPRTCSRLLTSPRHLTTELPCVASGIAFRSAICKRA